MIRYARLTSPAVQTGTESTPVMSVSDVSTEHTNPIGQPILRLGPPATEITVSPRTLTALLAPSAVRRSTPGARSPRRSERGRTRAPGSKRPCSW